MSKKYMKLVEDIDADPIIEEKEAPGILKETVTPNESGKVEDGDQKRETK